MHIVFRQNLGMYDANSLGLDFKKCQMGMEANVSGKTADGRDAAETLLKLGFAVDASKADDDELLVSWREEQIKQEAAKTVKAVAKPAAITAPSRHDKQ